MQGAGASGEGKCGTPFSTATSSCCRSCRARSPASTSQDLVEAALRRGASAYISKSVDPTDLPSTLHQAIEGNVFSSATLASGAEPTGAKAAGLTDRETSIESSLYGEE